MVIVFGSINVDLVARVARMPAPGETLSGSAFATAPGGKGANQALAARAAGADVALFGAVGNDAFAAAALENLVHAGVDLRGVASVDAPTGVALIHVDDRGQNAITVVAGANARAHAGQVPEHALGPGATLLLQLETRIEEVEALAARAHVAGARVVLNAAPARPLAESLLRSLDVLVVNEHEAALCADALGLAALPEAFLADLRDRFGLAGVVTLGAQGALAWVEGGIARGAPAPVAVVDTTGAGDAFTGALAAALDGGSPMADALQEALAAGARACTYAGAQRAP